MKPTVMQRNSDDKLDFLTESIKRVSSKSEGASTGKPVAEVKFDDLH